MDIKKITKNIAKIYFAVSIITLVLFGLLILLTPTIIDWIL